VVGRGIATAGYSPRTRQVYQGQIQRFLKGAGKPPTAITAEEVRAYLLHLALEEKNIRRVAQSGAQCNQVSLRRSVARAEQDSRRAARQRASAIARGTQPGGGDPSVCAGGESETSGDFAGDLCRRLAGE
jgi:hypothetical protein